MNTFHILALILLFLTIAVYLCEREKTKRERLRITAYLREREMDEGCAPGTYSSMDEYEEKNYSCKKIRREKLEEGIRNLEERIRNLDTILKSRKCKGAY